MRLKRIRIIWCKTDNILKWEHQIKKASELLNLKNVTVIL
jgi:hypothetical protein